MTGQLGAPRRLALVPTLGVMALACVASAAWAARLTGLGLAATVAASLGAAWVWRQATRERTRSDDTEQQRAARQIELLRSEQQLQLAEKVAHLGSFDWQPVTGELYWSDEHYRLWGWSPGGVVPSYAVFRQGIHPDDLPMLEALLRRALEGGRHYDCMHRVRHGDGTERHVRARGEVMFDAAGLAVRMIGTVEDITDRMAADRLLRAHQFAINSLSDMVSVVDENYAYRLVNDALCAVVGQTREQAIGRTVFDVLNARLEDDRGRALRDCMTLREPRTVRQAIARDAGTGRVRETRYYPYLEDGGLRGVVMVTRDVTEEERSREALARGVENLRLTLNATGDAIFASDAHSPDEPLLFANDQVRELWGIPANDPPTLTPDVIMAHARTLFIDERGENARVARIIESNRPSQDRLELRDGRVLERRCIPTERDGRVVRVWGFRDVTREERALQALREAKDQAVQASRAKTEFLSAMSHELRTPLNAVLGFGQLLEAASDLPKRERTYVGEILRGGRHLLALISDLLDLSRIEAGRLPVQSESVNLRTLSAECLHLVQPLAARHDVRLRLEQPPDDDPAPLVVTADRTRLRQVLLNLLSNAIKYNRAGGEACLRLHAHGARVRVSVQDDGRGLSAEQCERLFQPFERLGAENTTVEGAGIGLALSRELVRLMAGDIGVDSQPGVGSRFWIELPRRAAQEAAEATPSPVRADPDPAQAPATRTVLHIEDNPVNLLVMEAMLTHLPAVRVVNAALPETGLTLAQALRPDLVLLDIQLPGMDGLEVLRRLRSNPATATLPVVAVTANAMPDEVLAASDAGFQAYLTKPVELPLLLETVERLLNRQVTPH